MYVKINESNAFNNKYLFSYHRFWKFVALVLLNPYKYRENFTNIHIATSASRI